MARSFIMSKKKTTSDGEKMAAEFRPGLLNGVVTFRGRAVAMTKSAEGEAIPGKEQEFLAIPYYAWANRGLGEMVVWMPRIDAAAKTASPTK